MQIRSQQKNHTPTKAPEITQSWSSQFYNPIVKHKFVTLQHEKKSSRNIDEKKLFPLIEESIPIDSMN